MEEDIAAKYSRQLADLKTNSKPLISLLTLMAEEYISHALIIIQVIDKHIKKVDAKFMLPVLYLLDSILKNVGKDYRKLIVQNIFVWFCGVIEENDIKETSDLLLKLRVTWKDFIPAEQRDFIDYWCLLMDPNLGILNHEKELKAGGVSSSVITNPEQYSPHTSTSRAQSSSDLSSTSGMVMLNAEQRKRIFENRKKIWKVQTKNIELKVMKARLQQMGLGETQERVRNQQQSLETLAKRKPEDPSSSELPPPKSSRRKRVKVQGVPVPRCPKGSKKVSSSSSSKQPGISTTPAQESSSFVYQFDPKFDAWLMDMIFPSQAQQK